MRTIYLLLLSSGFAITANARTASAQGHNQSTTEAAKPKNQVSSKGKPATTTSATKAKKPAKAAAQARKAPAPAAVAATEPVAPAGAMAPTSGIALRDSPDGKSVASLTTHSVLEPLAREHGWVRVSALGWVKEDEVAPVDPSMVNLSAADLRADPDAARGKLVHWNVEVLAMQTADVLRKGLNPDEPYLLARGPGNESALIYVAIPPTLLVAARTMASSAPVPVALVATVRDGRSEPVGIPILEAQSFARR
jgi:hypothetical protein